ncbi:Cytosine-specific methyltransferase [Xenorhabdus bovienii str. kraussei Quebec]|uniref:Cytosine-specific methyltransferase n=1 Tax=Xenorhabdus bovienii str. kraussei Quebec TaxID=1398203 RepID=A0A077PJP5_XENBV|nr:DNA cytosine methyltransferase [Xenorhabdus bovienii]CDH19934.1 Cytosine-specific methyltransferase [Xenorhabdus bovienii str. kraussei Quebec]
MMRFGSVCSGIEAASVAWEPLGLSPAWFSEIEKFPSAVLRYHWPHVRNLGDMTQIPAMIAENQADAPDILVGGTPCQAFSIAGLRNGLGDERGQLTLSFVELANVIDSVRAANGEQPSIIVWENVPGVLSSKDNAFGCFLAGLAGEDEPLQPSGKKWTNAGYVSGPQRTVAWRVLDAQYFGVAQRRRRVFVVASARKDVCPATVLFEPDRLRRHSEPCGTAEKAVAGNAGSRAVIGSHWDSGLNPHPTLNQSHNTGGIGMSNQEIFSQRGSGLVSTYRLLSFGEYRTDDISSTLRSRDDKSATDLVAIALAGNTINRAPQNGGNGIGYHPEISYTLTTTDVHGVNYGYAVRRLTPVECERLQGFSDNHTQIPWNGKTAADCPDGHRYRAIGNSMAVPVMAWIGKRILMQRSV